MHFRTFWATGLVACGVLAAECAFCADVASDDSGSALEAIAGGMGYGAPSATVQIQKSELSKPVQPPKPVSVNAVRPPEKATNSISRVEAKSRDISIEQKNARGLLAWMKDRSKRTSVQDEDEFKSYVGKSVVFSGDIDDVRADSDCIQVNLVVGRLDEFERLIARFEVSLTHGPNVLKWKKGGKCVLRGRVKKRGWLVDDVVCVCDEILDSSHSK